MRAQLACASDIGGARRCAGACRLLRRRRLSAADPGDERIVAGDAGAARSEKHAEGLAGPGARCSRKNSELEVWKQDTTGQFQLLKVYPICRWSGELGPKKVEGDRQAPEGFYSITPGLMNPNSNYYLAINIGFPNAYDKANGYSGAFLMIHGDCSSRGCYAMTDEQIGEIYSLARESFLGGQKQFQIQAYPFRMTAANLARHRTNPNMPFWKMIKEGNDHFEVTHLEPKVDVCERHYVFDAQPPANSTKPLVVHSDRPLPGLRSSAGDRRPGAGEATQRRIPARAIDQPNVPVAPVTMGTDGGMNRVFVAKLETTGPVLRQRRASARAAGPSRHAAADSAARRDPSRRTWLQPRQAAPRRGFVRQPVQRQIDQPAVAVSRVRSRPPRRSHRITRELLRQPVQAEKRCRPADHARRLPPGTVLAGLRPRFGPAQIRTGQGRGAKARTAEGSAAKARAQIAQAPKPKRSRSKTPTPRHPRTMAA